MLLAQSLDTSPPPDEATLHFDAAGIQLQRGRYSKFSAMPSCGMFSLDHPLRRLCMAFVTSKAFDVLVMAVILVNVCIISALEPQAPVPLIDETTVFRLEIFFQCFYTVEALIRIIAMGVIRSKRSYFRNGWCIFDFLLIILGWISFIPGVANLIVFRTIRIFRLIRTFYFLKGLRTMTVATMYSLRGLLSVAVLLLFMYFLFGLIGVQFFGGHLHQRCYSDVTGEEIVGPILRLCSNSSVGLQCPSNSTCLRIAENPQLGKVSFDNSASAILMLFGMMTTDGWVFIMYWLQESVGWPVTIYCVLFIVATGFFVVNLVVAVVVDEFENASEKVEEESQAQADYQQKLAHLGDASTSTAASRRRDTAVAAHGSRMDACRSCWRSSRAAGKREPTNALRLRVHNLVTHSAFELTYAVIIVLNCITLLLYHYQMSYVFERFLEISNYIFVSLYLLEFLLKLIGLGVRGYFFDGWNLFDFIILVVSLVELALDSQVALVFRIMRLFRAMRLARRWKGLQNVLRVTFRSLPQILYLTIILTIVMFVFAVIGRDLFSGTLDFEGNLLPRSHFDDLGTSMITTFQILTGDSWTANLYTTMKGAGDAASLWFVAWILVGGLMMVNLWVAVILAGFGLDDEEEEEVADEDADDDGTKNNAPRAGDMIELPSVVDFDPEAPEAILRAAVTRINRAETQFELPAGLRMRMDPSGNVDVSKEKTKELHGRSFFVFGPENKLRQLLATIIWSTVFEVVITLLIVANMVVLALDNVGVTRTSDLGQAIDVLELVFNIVFSVEMVMRMIVMGFIGLPGAYWRSGWEILDGLIVIISWVAYPFDIGFLRAFRAFRALRILGKFQNTRVVIWSILKGFQKAMSVSAVALLFWVIFGVVAVQLWQGSLYYCNDSSIMFEANCTGFFDPSLLIDSANASNVTAIVRSYRQFSNTSMMMMGNATEGMIARVWQNPPWNFDNFGYAFLALFQTAIGVSWIDVGWSVIDAVGPGRQPIFNHDPARILFFFAFQLIVTFFVLNLFIGAVIDAFTEMKKQAGASPFLTKRQAEWVDTQRVLQFIKPDVLPRPSTFLPRRVTQRIILSKAFQWTIMGCIIVNAAVIACTHYQMSAEWELAIDICNYLFAAVFILEALLKIYGLGPKMYFSDPWCLFDFIIVLLSILSIALSRAELGVDVQLSGLRALRLLRLLRLVKFLTPLRILWETLTGAFLQVFNVMICIFVVIYMFSILGMYIMGPLEFGLHINAQNNFRTFGNALGANFRLMTTDTWVWVMFDAMNIDLGGDPWTSVYFVVYIIISNWIILNVILAVLLDSFVDFQNLNEKKLKLGEFSRLSKIYFHFDKYGRGSIPVNTTIMILQLLSPPLGPPNSGDMFGAGSSFADMIKHLTRLNVHVTLDNMVFYSSLTRALTKSVLGVTDDELFELERDPRESEFTLAEAAAAVLIQRQFRRWKALGYAGKKKKRGLLGRIKSGRSSQRNSLRLSRNAGTGSARNSMRMSASRNSVKLSRTSLKQSSSDTGAKQ